MAEVHGDRSQGRLAELIERLEKATGPDRELDAEICRMIGGIDVKQSEYGDHGYIHNVLWPPLKSYQAVLRYTASIDAALTLVPEAASGWDCGRIDSGYCASVEFAVDVDGFHNYHAKSSVNAAIALCIAALKARTHSPSTPSTEGER